jgi:hypothetical protein
MELAVVTLAIVAFLLLLVPASLLPLLAGAALGADTIDHPDRTAQFEGIAEVWDDERIAA